MWFNRCPFQLLRSYKRHEENKRKIGQERSSMQQADYQITNVIGPLHECKKVCPWMQESVSMNARKCVHAQKPCPSQAFAHESSKVGGRGKREERQERQRPGGWWKERQPNKTKTHLRNWNKAYLGTDRLTKQGEERLTSPSHRMWHPVPYSL